MSNTPIDKLLPLEIRELINRLAQQTAASINDSEGIPELRQTMSKELRETIQLAVKGKLRELALAMLPHAERDATIRELRALCGEAAVQLDEYLDYERTEHICIVIGDVALAAKLRAASEGKL